MRRARQIAMDSHERPGGRKSACFRVSADLIRRLAASGTSLVSGRKLRLNKTSNICQTDKLFPASEHRKAAELPIISARLLLSKTADAIRLILPRSRAENASIPQRTMSKALSNDFASGEISLVVPYRYCYLCEKNRSFRGDSATSVGWIKPSSGVLVYRPEGFV